MSYTVLRALLFRDPPSLSSLYVKHSFCPVGHNFCAEAPKCGENSECKNWNTKATCECKNGYISVQGNSAYCEGKDSQVLWGSGREVCFQLLQIWIWLCKGINSHGLSNSFMWETKSGVRSYSAPTVHTNTRTATSTVLSTYWLEERIISKVIVGCGKQVPFSNSDQRLA